jgi:hypothetical protein
MEHQKVLDQELTISSVFEFDIVLLITLIHLPLQPKPPA